MMIYGTAWKEEQTAGLVKLALDAGFRAIDTANQRKHYDEEGVGRGIRDFLETRKCMRSDLFLQTKYTYARGQDHRLPYDERTSYSMQVRQSFQLSLEHLGTDYLDSLLMHSPFHPQGLSAEDFEVWREMEKLYDDKKVRAIGVSNFSAEQLSQLALSARIKPKFVQNRCYARTGWDRRVRSVCTREGITYQGFSLLTANVAETNTPLIRDLAEKHGKTPAQILFAFSRAVGMIPITGTTSSLHMQEDLASIGLQLSPEEISKIESISG